MLWLEGIGFLTIVGLSWIHELGGARLWYEAAFETAVTTMVAVPVILGTFNVVSRLYALEQFLRVCAWCRKIHCDGAWYTVETSVQPVASVALSAGCSVSAIGRAPSLYRDTT